MEPLKIVSLEDFGESLKEFFSALKVSDKTIL